jgi:hypothetical protein
MMLPHLVRQARRRLIWNELFAHGAQAVNAALVALIALLLAGTQVLHWHWAALLPAAAAAYGIFLTWRSRPALYGAAQVVDRRLALADTLSTALYFDQEPNRSRTPEQIRAWQYSLAEKLSATVDVREAVPFSVPRAGYAAAALLLVASSLFALRYGLSHRLDLRPPLARIIHQSMGGTDPARQNAGAKKDAPRSPEALDQTGMAISEREAESLDPASKDALGQSAIPDLDNSRTTQAKSQGLEQGDQISLDEPGEESGEGGSGSESGEGKKGAGQSKEGEQAATGQQPGSSEKNSLLDKFREAMQGMLSKMKQPPQGAGQQSQMAQNGKQAKSQQAGKQNSGQGQKQKDSGQGESQEGEAGDDAQADQDAQSRGAGQNGEQQANKQPGSGIGKQDGDKDVKLAEQMAAMGKLSEIIGKRSANVTGEAMVEVKNTSQQLSTRYEAKRAAHTESGAEISRDEVPVALQGYVQQYFEQVRKGEGKAEKK